MMNATAPGTGLLLLWGLHIISIIVVGIGIALLLIWAFKHLSKQGLCKWGWMCVVIGTILCLLTISAWPSFGMMGGFNDGFDRNNKGMMPVGQINNQAADPTAQSKEEADGKVLYDKLQARQTACTDLADSDFELIGEYVMGQRAGASHEQMNNMIKQMMGGDDAPMHIFLGRNATGCTTGTQSSQPFRGMMNGDGMMGGSANASSNAAPVDGHHTSSVTP